jgi:hypothetical protein
MQVEDSAMRVTTNCIKNQKHSKLCSMQLPILTCGYTTKLVPMGREIAELVSDNHRFSVHSDIRFEYGLMWDKSVQRSGPFIKYFRARILTRQLHCSLSLLIRH